MNLRGIVSVSGKPGLWKALAQNKNGFVLESLDTQKTKLVANLATAKIAALDEITIFGTDEDIRLLDVFARMKDAEAVPDAKADGKQLRRFFREVAPDHDEEKVYASDMKKVISWFHILKDLPIFIEEEAAADGEASATEEPVVTAVPDIGTNETEALEAAVKKAEPQAEASPVEPARQPAKKAKAK